METSQNPYLDNLEKAMKDAIKAELKPFIEENRKLRFMLGLAIGYSTFDGDLSVEVILDHLCRMAANSTVWQDNSIPADLLTIAGSKVMEAHIGSFAGDEETKDFCPSKEDLEALTRIFGDLRRELDCWFREFKSPVFMNENIYKIRLPEFCPSKHGNNLKICTAWNALAKLNRMFHTGFDAVEYEEYFGDDE